MKFVKGFYVNYKNTQAKLQDAIIDIIKKGDELTVKNVAKQAKVGVSTAYEHGLQGTVRRLVGKDVEEAEEILKELNAVTKEELQRWANKVCKRLGLPSCDTMIYLDMVDDYIEIIGENEGGCMVVFEAGNPKKFCVVVEQKALKKRQFVYNTLLNHLGKYKKYMEEVEEDEKGKTGV